MEKVQENGAKFNLSLRVGEFMNRGFVSNGSEPKREEDEEVELSLGLSLNGRFGVDPERKKLRRSSSIADMVFDDFNGTVQKPRGLAAESHASLLTRACSLPTETAEEVLRRKELQSVRRMEARKKRMEKLKNVNVVNETVNLLVSDNVNYRRVDNENPNGNGMPPFPSPQRSIGSLASGSSGISETQSQLIDGAKQNAEVKSPSSIQSVAVAQMERRHVEAVFKGENGAKEMLKKAMLEMPCVSMKGDGKNVNKINGLLYRYKKGEEVRIICICHGFLLSPAEFVKHAGGGDVDNPLKHIVVNPSPHLPNIIST